MVYKQGCEWSCTLALRVIQVDLSGAGRVVCTSRPRSLQSGFQSLMPLFPPVYGRTCPPLPPDDSPYQLLTRPAAAATAARGTATPPATSRPARSGRLHGRRPRLPTLGRT